MESASEYREGVVVERPARRAGKGKTNGCYVNCGLKKVRTTAFSLYTGVYLYTLCYVRQSVSTCAGVYIVIHRI